MPFKKKDEMVNVEHNFFNEDYSFTPEEAEQLVNIIALPGFRLFERYLARKQNKKAHAMISSTDTERMLELRAQIKGFGEVTGDLKMLWEQVKRKQDEEAQSLSKHEGSLSNGKSKTQIP